jgi:hypothetical protein
MYILERVLTLIVLYPGSDLKGGTRIPSRATIYPDENIANLLQLEQGS